MDRSQYPRVSDILAAYSKKDLELIAPDVLSHAAERGTKVHALCTGYARGLWLPMIDEECKPYFESFKAWYDENKHSVILTEERLFDDELKFSGQLDMLVKKGDGSLALIDLKTGATESRSWALQLAAYEHLLKLNGYEARQSTILKLKKTSCRAKEITYKSENLIPFWNLFKGALDLYAYYNTKEVKNESDTSP